MTRRTRQLELSIIIVSWNTRDILRECLASIRRAGTAAPLEVIVVDNASSDGSPEMVASEFPDVHLIRNTENRGFGPANNQGMRVARAPYLLLLNSDTVILGSVLENGCRWMQRHPECAVLGCRVLNDDLTLQRTCFRDPDLTGLALNATGLHRVTRPRWFGRQEMRHWNRDDVRDVDVVTGCFMLVRREAVASVGGFDEQFFFYAEEADWCRRFRSSGWRVMFAPVGEIVHLGGASALHLNERRSLLLGSALVRYIRKHRGIAAAIAAWMLIVAFLALRAVLWTGVGVVRRDAAARERGRQFRRAVRGARAVWARREEARVADVCSQRPKESRVTEPRIPMSSDVAGSAGGSVWRKSKT